MGVALRQQSTPFQEEVLKFLSISCVHFEMEIIGNQH